MPTKGKQLFIFSEVPRPDSAKMLIWINKTQICANASFSAKMAKKSGAAWRALAAGNAEQGSKPILSQTKPIAEGDAHSA